MIILQINSAYRYGSTGYIMANISNAIEHAGWQSYVAYGNLHTPASTHEYKISNTLQQKLSNICSRINGRHGFYDWVKTKKLIQWMEYVSPDIVHLHNIHGHYINIEILFNYLTSRQIPIVWTLHDCWSFTGRCAHYELAGCYQWQTSCQKCPNLKNYLPAAVDRSKSNFSRKKHIFTTPENMFLVPCSKWLKKEIEKSFLGKKYPIRVINNGIDLKIFQRTTSKPSILPEAIKNQFIILGFAAKWLQPENLSKTIWFLEHLDDNCVLVLLGAKTIPESLASCAKLYAIPYVASQKQLALYYSEANIMANVTLEDTLPTVNMEALACGTPVVTYDSGGSAEIISPETGIVAEKGNIAAMLEACNFIKNNPGYFSPEKCRQRAESHFDAQKQFSYYIDIYKEILNLKPQI